MSLVSNVGRRSLKVRLLFLGMYLILSVGAISMVYPFMLMLGTATTGGADSSDLKIVPSYWISDAALYKKYLLDSTGMNSLSVWYSKDNWFIARDMTLKETSQVMDVPAQQRTVMARDTRNFIAKVCPPELKFPAFNQDRDSHLSFETRYHDWLKSRYKTLDKINRAYMDNAGQWVDLTVPAEQTQRRPDDTQRMRDYREFVESGTPNRTSIYSPDEDVYYYIQTVQIPESYKKSIKGKLNLSLITYDDIAAGKLGSKIRKEFVTTRAAARFIHIDAAQATPAWRKFMAENGGDPGSPLPERMPLQQKAAGMWGLFIQRACPLDSIHLIRPEDYWRPYIKSVYGNIDNLNKAYGTSYSSFDKVRIPMSMMRLDSFLQHRSELRRNYLTHNFSTVMEFVTVHGNALVVTIVYIILTILTTLTVNPLAAYAMSRFRLKESYHVLVFLLATMAFPGEVLMIPSFLMIKSFPLLQILTVGVCLLAFILIQSKLKKRMNFLLSATVALVITLGLVAYVVPHVAGMFNIKLSVSLMNSFWALILPGLANGYGIFLLKGFFDSLPPELYEAGLIDGAGEMTMFWKITLPLCKPILAVLALGAFSAAYGAFMHAFLVCQDPKMWTLMVFLYEFQQLHGVSMAMASLVIAALPTLIVFIFCQNIILRGIVIPTYK